MKKTTMGVVSVALLALGLAAGIVMVPAKTARANTMVGEDVFPDENFRNWIISQYGESVDNIEIAETKYMDISNLGITDLTGIEYFDYLDKLICNGNDIKKFDYHIPSLQYLDLTGCDKLEEIELCYNVEDGSKLSNLIVDGCTGLKTLVCENAPLGTLDVESCTDLEGLGCSNCGLNSIKANGLSKLKVFSCSNNNLKNLELKNCSSMTMLFCNGNLISDLNLEGCGGLLSLYCSANPNLTKLDTTCFPNLTYIDCHDCKIKDLNVSGSVLLKYLDCSGNPVVFLDLYTNHKMEVVNCKKCKELLKLYKNSYFEDSIIYSDLNDAQIITLSPDDWSFESYKWIGSDTEGYTAVDFTFKCTLEAAENYKVTARGYAQVVSAKAATCEETGEIKYRTALPASICRLGREVTVFKTVVVPATGHDWGDWFLSKEPTLNNEGEETRICRHDASHKQTRKVKKLTPTPTNKPAVTITLDKKSGEIVAGRTLTLKATVKGSKKTVSWKSSNSKIATVDKNGKITAKQVGKVTITASCDGKTAKCEIQVLFKDVTNKNDFWYKPAYYLSQKGVVKGYENETEFRPNNDCTRAQVVTFLYRLQGEPKTDSTICKFVDVKSSDYFFKAVIWAVEKEITTGVSSSRFNPLGVCTRAQVVTFLWRMAGRPEPKAKNSKFSDVNKNDYYYKSSTWANEIGILSGYSDGSFKPQGKCLRKQMVTFLYKYDKYVNGKG